MQTDVKASFLSVSGTAFAGPARLKGLVITTTGDGNLDLVITDGGASGVERFKTTTANNVGMYNILIPGEGIKFDTDIYVTIPSGDFDVTVFYG